ncbi:hypothetical protein BJQ94_13705 [Cryobacterium sp. SO2]|uniref:P-loop ATPase, Sll1717 family n=1 Tax=Cryobacterium sp. SO2 TaxID=1897060 RepID=UPI00223CC9DA|nr:hypothetical protein [Cryobacterium sp. SO2]WEO76414.1 hypothetical protein BJQ94_13705 [Cryobacterium sp. SO2]
MSIESYLQRAGFVGDPLAHTNAEQEDRLGDYFVPPPYFQSVLGDPATPKSNVIFAPRGGGKTAQRLMIEREAVAPGATYLCLTYDAFASVVSHGGGLAAHHVELCRIVTLAILSYLEDESMEAIFLSDHERQIVKVAAQQFVGVLGLGEYKAAVGAVKTLGDKAGDFWKKYGGPVAAGVALLMKRAGLDDVNISITLEQQAQDSGAASSYYFLSELVEIAKKLGWEAVYFLVDKVDETPSTTNNAEAAGKLILELVTDLPTLETPGAAFKFFFWDQMEEYLRTNGLRGDRVEVVNLGWSVNELSEMLSRRLAAFSNNRVTSFNQIVDSPAAVDFHKVLVYLSHGSPRDMIRMARSIVKQHTRMPNEAATISPDTVARGIVEFSKESTIEKFGRFQSDFSRISSASFTLTDLASVFKISPTGVTNKVNAWIPTGAVRPLGTRPNPGAKPLNLYGFADLRIVIASSSDRIGLVLSTKAVECADCGNIIYANETALDCPNCGSKVIGEAARSLLEVCALQH